MCNQCGRRRTDNGVAQDAAWVAVQPAAAFKRAMHIALLLPGMMQRRGAARLAHLVAGGMTRVASRLLTPWATWSGSQMHRPAAKGGSWLTAPSAPRLHWHRSPYKRRQGDQSEVSHPAKSEAQPCRTHAALAELAALRTLPLVAEEQLMPGMCVHTQARLSRHHEALSLQMSQQRIALPQS
jgi:hypothetical protein